MFCPECGSSVADGAAFCPNCGHAMQAGQAPVGGQIQQTPVNFQQNSQPNGYQQGGFQQGAYQSNGYQQPYYNGPVNEPGKGQAVASLVFGIISVVFLFFLPFISIILGIIGLILSVAAKKSGFEGGLRTAGFVLSIIGIAFGAVEFIACIACLGSISAGSAGAYEVLDEIGAM